MRALILLATLVAAQPAHAQERWTLRPELRIGATDGPAALSAVHAIVVSPSGEKLYATQAMEYVIKVFDAATGATLGTLGRRGSGPGEFMSLGYLGWKGDTLTASDRIESRISYFDVRGRHVRTQRIAPVPVGKYQSIVPARVAPNGHLWAEPPSINMMGVANGVITHQPVRILDSTGRMAQTVADLAVQDVIMHVRSGNAGGVFQRPLTPWPRLDYTPSGDAVAILEPRTGTQDQPTFTVSRLGYDGKVLYRKAFKFSAVEVPNSVRDSLYEKYSFYFSRGNSSAAAIEMAKRHIPVPSTYPSASEIMHLSSGEVWVKREPERASAVWIVLNPGGEVIATLHAPPNVKLLAGDAQYAWGVVKGEFDVPYIVRYAIERKPGR